MPAIDPKVAAGKFALKHRKDLWKYIVGAFAGLYLVIVMLLMVIVVVFFGGKDASATCNVGASQDTLIRYLQALAEQESNGNPTASAGTSSASGKYQYISSTWHAVSKIYYLPADAYATAASAPETSQDAVAYLEYHQKFKDFDG